MATTVDLMTPIPSQVPVTEGVADLGNVKLWFWDTGGPGEVIVLLHPASGSAESYPYQQSAFAKAGYRVISYSRRGQYRSEAGADAAECFGADDLLRLMDHLKVGTFQAVGNALGAYVGLDAAMSEPGRVRSLVVACSMMGITDPEYVAASLALRPKGFNEMPAEFREVGPSYRAANPEGVAAWRAMHERAGPTTPVKLRNTITFQSLASLTVPVMLMTGDADLWIPPALLRMVGEKMPRAKVVVVPDAGHAVQWEQPRAFNAAVLEFIRSVT